MTTPMNSFVPDRGALNVPGNVCLIQGLELRMSHADYTTPVISTGTGGKCWDAIKHKIDNTFFYIQ